MMTTKTIRTTTIYSSDTYFCEKNQSICRSNRHQQRSAEVFWGAVAACHGRNGRWQITLELLQWLPVARLTWISVLSVFMIMIYYELIMISLLWWSGCFNMFYDYVWWSIMITWISQLDSGCLIILRTAQILRFLFRWRVSHLSKSIRCA
jgi:hypothetical protein